MAQNPFTRKPGDEGMPKRNSFDLSHDNNLTFNFGQLIPDLCLEAIPGDSFRINADIGLRLQPMVWPVQTPMRVHQYFFQIRLRNLWDDYMDFYGQTKQGLVMPFISGKTTEFFMTKSLSDYLGVPTTQSSIISDKVFLPWTIYEDRSVLAGATLGTKQTEFERASRNGMNQGSLEVQPMYKNSASFPSYSYLSTTNVSGQRLKDILLSSYSAQQNLSTHRCLFANYPITQPLTNGIITFDASVLATTNNANSIYVGILLYNKAENHFEDPSIYNSVFSRVAQYTPTLTNNKLTITLSQSDLTYINATLVNKNYSVFLVFSGNNTTYFPDPNTKENSQAPVGLGTGYSYNTARTSVNGQPTNSPFTGTNPAIRISALPYRAYEAVYNSFFREPTIDPFTINGTPEYNKYIPNSNGGADTYNYQIRYRTWEKDYLTTCMTSPQQGIAPLVGVTTNNGATEATFKFQLEDGSNTIMTTNIGANGDITGISYIEPNMPLANRMAMTDSIVQGISINDFRQVNSLQRWLEKNIRRGYRFKEIIESHFGKAPRYNELDMPEFLGGFSRDINVSSISNTNGSDGQLGEIAGQAGLYDKSDHSISVYVDEPSIILGIVCVMPSPVYTQMLPKLFTKHSAFDFFFPEFGHIGYQPITYENVTPLESYGNNQNLKDVFGYQRAWWDYLSHPDVAHGEMRTTMANYLVNRVFAGRPQLGREFITMKPEQVNDIFNYTGSDFDKIIGQIHFDINAERPIPAIGTPRLE